MIGDAFFVQLNYVTAIKANKPYLSTRKISLNIFSGFKCIITVVKEEREEKELDNASLPASEKDEGSSLNPYSDSL